MHHRTATARAVLCAVTLALLAAACGTRLSNEQTTTGGTAGSQTTSPSSNSGGGGSTAATKFGNLASPCGPAAGGAPAAPSTPTPGVTADKIRIGVISDRTGPVPVPTAGIDGSMTAFAEWCNAQGGINGRQLDLVHYDSATLAEGEAMTKACGDNLFALVGSGSVQDDAGAEAMVKCGLVEVAGYTATYPKGLSPRLVQPVPNPGNYMNVGPGKFIAKKFPNAIKAAGEFFPSYPPIGQIQADRVKDAYTPLGFKFQMVQPTDIILGIDGWGQWVNQMKSKNLQWVSGITFTQDTVAMLAAMTNAGYKPQVVDLGQQYYDASVPGKPGTEGILVLTNTSPFQDTDNAAISEYTKLLAQYAKGTPPTSLGVQSFSAGLLFAQAAKSLGNDLTRDKLLAALHDVHKWDGGGLHMPTDPGSNAVNSCFLYMTVKNGKWVRYWPKSDKDGTEGFDCSSSYAVKLSRSYAALPPGWTTGG